MKGQELECFYKSFQGSGSLYVGKESSLKCLELLSKYTIRAIVIISASMKGSFPSNFEILQLGVQERDPTSLKNNFDSSFYFIDKHRLKTNILVCSSEGSNLATPHILAYLMKKYSLRMQAVSPKPQDRILKDIQLKVPEEYIQQLNRISLQFEKEKEEEDDQDLRQTTLGKRIIRIRKEYGNLADGSRFGSIPKKPSQKVNPEYMSLKKGTPSKDLGFNELKLETVKKHLFDFEKNMY